MDKISWLKRTAKVAKHREAGDPKSSRKSLSRPKYEPIILELGVTHDSNFIKWANKCLKSVCGQGTGVPSKDLRKDIIIEICGDVGQLAITYKVCQCWISDYRALPDLADNTNAFVIEYVKLENEGLGRDYGIKGPMESSSN